MRVSKDNKDEAHRALLRHLTDIQEFLQAQDVILRIKPRSIWLEIKSENSFSVNKLSEHLAGILPSTVELPHWY